MSRSLLRSSCRLLCCLGVLTVLLLGRAVASGSEDVPRVISGDEVWSGQVVLEGSLQIPEGASLTLQPGTELRFPANAAFEIQGRLTAKGSAAKPIVCLPAVAGAASGFWQGLSIHSRSEKVELEHLVVDGAALSLQVSESLVHVASATLRNGAKGVVTGIGARLVLDNVLITGMSEGGVEASVKSQVQVLNCRIEKVAGFGVQAGQQAAVLVRNNRITGAKFGILIAGDFPPLEGNVLENCELGIGVAHAGPSAIVRGNRVSGGKVGIACQQFASPLVERNIITDCAEGVTCFQGASPMIRQNRFEKNQRAISCVQMCYPMITLNDFINNDCSVYLHLSSYARIEANNFEGGRLHVELDNMSYDWEVRATKPMRNRQKQNEAFMRSGKAATGDAQAVSVESEGFVNAKGNYWGVATTQEIVAKGLEANLAAIQDAFDVPTRTYEGWPGEYLQDRVRYDDWKAEKISGTGP